MTTARAAMAKAAKHLALRNAPVPHATVFQRFALVAGATLIAGCAVTAPPPPVEPVVIGASVDETSENAAAGIVIQGIDPDVGIRSEALDGLDPWDLSAEADRAAAGEAVSLRLDAIDGFLELQEYPAAETQANFLVDRILDPRQALRFDLQRGRIAAALGQYPLALSYLQPLRGVSALGSEPKAQLYEALANSQLALGRRVDALVSLLARDSLLDTDPQLENQQRIVEVMRTLSPIEQSILRESASRNGLPANLVDGWRDLIGLLDIPDNDRRALLYRWSSAYANHPARQELLGGARAISLRQFNHVALLLPLTSTFGNAAKAFYDGFIESYNNDQSRYRPAVSLHDIGEDPELAAFYYRSAMNEGADFIVGPLGRNAVNTLLSGNSLPLPTLVVGDISPGHEDESVYGISLSPESEAQQVAERAFAAGHRQAGIFRSDSAWGSRTADAFAQRWNELGGTIVTNKSFPDTIEDYSRIIQRLLEVNQSVSRERVLSAQLGINLEFTPRRRDDLDLLFFAGNARQARLLIPQMRFFQAHDLPVYATSNIFDGSFNPAVDADLDDVIFGDIGWMVRLRYPPQSNALLSEPEVLNETATAESTELETAADSEQPPIDQANNVNPRPIAKSPYSFTSLDRLYALGLESYHLIPRLETLRRDSWQRYIGQAFSASVQRDGNIVRHLEWATFEDGNIVLLNQPEAFSPVPPQ